MPNKKVHVESIGAVTLSDKDFIASGGQASVYKKKGYAFKIYHEEKDMIPDKKIKELGAIKADNVLKPIEAVYDMKKKPIGYIMDFVKGDNSLCRLFTKTFKNNNGISSNDVAKLIAEVQKTVVLVHESDCLIVDLNEMNVMVDNKFKKPIFLDVDSYKTPSFQATALMENIRDGLVKNNEFTEYSDWYAWAIITFNLYTGVHPYRGKHPDYKMNQWRKRMDDGISVFDKNVSVPPFCSDFSIIPQRHLDWYKDIFVNNNRTIPPFTDSKIPVPVGRRAVVIIRKSENFEITEKISIDAPILDVFVEFGVIYSLTKDSIYRGNNKVADRKGESNHIIFNSGKMILVTKDKNEVSFETLDGTFSAKDSVEDIMYKDGRIYSVYADQVFEHMIADFGGKLIHTKRNIAQVISNQYKVYDGVIIQRGAHRTIMILPFDAGMNATVIVPEIDKCKVVNAKTSGRFVVVLTSKNGVYSRMIFKFNKDFSSYEFRRVDDVDMAEINFTVLPNGVCVLVSGQDKMEIFTDFAKIKEVDNPPFDSSMKIFSTIKGIHFIDEDRVCHTTMKN